MKIGRLTLPVASLLLAACTGKTAGTPTATPAPLQATTPVAGATTAAATQPTAAQQMGSNNHNPTLETVEIEAVGGATGDAHPNTKDTLKAKVKFSDIDGDLLTAKYSWKLNGTDVGTGETFTSPTLKKNDSITLDVVVTDARGAESGHRNATVRIRNSAPQFTSTPAGSLNGYKPVAVDPDGDPVTIEVSGLPAGFTFANGALAFDPASGKAAAGKSVSILAKDNDGATASQNITISF
jgi:hypothetical protein